MMGFTIRRDGNGYRIGIGDGRPVYTRTTDLEPVIEALKHYYDGKCKRAVCAFCKQIQAKAH